MNIYIQVIALVLSLGSLNAIAQQSPMYTHYMNNTLVVNPAYAGSRDALTLTALHRSQWVGYEGAPVTQTLTAHTPVKNEHIGLGFSLLNDKIGPTNTTSLFVYYAYRLKVSEKSKLSLGLSAGANIFQANLVDIQLDQQVDPAFAVNIKNSLTPNFGFGAYYSRERFYAGISIPNLLENNYAVASQTNQNTLVAKEQRHFFFIAGSIFTLTENLAFKPTTLVKYTPAAPIQADLTTSFIIMKKLLVGVMYRSGDAFGALVGLDITEQLHIGYSFDASYGMNTPKYNQGSHELLVRYDFIFMDKRQIHSPRYF
jgi:type IX secretion system PorP/SprF family membrane protein